MPRVIEVIESQVYRGEGDPHDPCRIVIQYHTLEGEFLAENDPHPVVPERNQESSQANEEKT